MLDRPGEATPNLRQRRSDVFEEIDRSRLLALCRRLTGDRDAAEDLAQDTLFEAWRNQHKLHDPSGVWPWIVSIARNLARRWWRTRGRDGERLALSSRGMDATLMKDNCDMELELERQELADLLDRALSLLSPHDREVLVQRYVSGSTHAEIAARLELTEGVIAKRLERGRLKLQRVLSTDFLREATAYRLLRGNPAGWQETTIWCTVCGVRRLFGRFTLQRELYLICIGCRGRRAFISLYNCSLNGAGRLFEGTRGFRAALHRLASFEYERLKDGIVGRSVRCSVCQAEAALYAATDELTIGKHFVGAECPRCGATLVHTSLCFLALYTPEGRRFWRVYPRVRSLPTRELEASGRAVVVSGYESVCDGARFQVVFDRDTFQVLGTLAVPEWEDASRLSLDL